MNLRYALFFLIIVLGGLKAEESIWVELETESPLLPLYMTPLSDHQAGFNPEYLKHLQEILAYDLNYNGMTKLISDNKNLNELIKKGSFEELGDPADLKKVPTYYIVKSRVRDKKLSVRLITLSNLSMKAIDDIVLTGDLSKDRRQIHRLADTLHKHLFGVAGIASTHFLFTNKSLSPRTQKVVSEVYEADWDGANARPLTQDCGYAVTPAYLPPKEGSASGSFLYVSYATGQPKIYYSSLKEYKPVRFSLMKGNQLMPAVSKNRNQIAFVSDVTGNPDLFIQSINSDGSLKGKPSQIFSAPKASQGTPTFSPDGKNIAFVSNKDGAARVYFMEIPTPGASLKNLRPTLVSRHTKESTAPAWSPDGKKIAYASRTDGIRQIWVYDLEKKHERQLTHGPGNKENPAWAPNSLHLIFNSTQNDIADLYILNLNQPEAIKVTSGLGSKRFPSWEPRL